MFCSIIAPVERQSPTTKTIPKKWEFPIKIKPKRGYIMANSANLQDDFLTQINTFFESKDTLALLHLNRIRKGKGFYDVNSCFNVSLEERKSQSPDYQRYIDLGYMEYLGRKPYSYKTDAYKLTIKGMDIIDQLFEKALKEEKLKAGKIVTLKEYEELSNTINGRDNILTGGTLEEFKRQNYPERMQPLIEQAKNLLKRPFGVKAFPYKGNLERDIERVKSTIERWNRS